MIWYSDDMELKIGIKTSPMHVTYDEICRVWQQADEMPEIADAWLWDHMMPLAGDRGGPALEGWTTLGALAARTSRLRMGLLVTSNRFRAPALLGKMASTVDVISGGRLIMGLGVGGTVQPADAGGMPGENPGVMEYAAYGIPLISPREGVARLVETVTILRRMWTEDVFDFAGPFTTLIGNRNAPKPVQPAGPPLLIGAWGDRMLRVVAEHADIWNIPGPPHNSVEALAERSRMLDRALRGDRAGPGGGGALGAADRGGGRRRRGPRDDRGAGGGGVPTRGGGLTADVPGGWDAVAGGGGDTPWV